MPRGFWRVDKKFCLKSNMSKFSSTIMNQHLPASSLVDQEVFRPWETTIIPKSCRENKELASDDNMNILTAFKQEIIEKSFVSRKQNYSDFFLQSKEQNSEEHSEASPGQIMRNNDDDEPSAKYLRQSLACFEATENEEPDEKLLSSLTFHNEGISSSALRSPEPLDEPLDLSMEEKSIDSNPDKPTAGLPPLPALIPFQSEWRKTERGSHGSPNNLFHSTPVSKQVLPPVISLRSSPRPRSRDQVQYFNPYGHLSNTRLSHHQLSPSFTPTTWAQQTQAAAAAAATSAIIMQSRLAAAHAMRTQALRNNSQPRFFEELSCKKHLSDPQIPVKRKSDEFSRSQHELSSSIEAIPPLQFSFPNLHEQFRRKPTPFSPDCSGVSPNHTSGSQSVNSDGASTNKTSPNYLQKLTSDTIRASLEKIDSSELDFDESTSEHEQQTSMKSFLADCKKKQPKTAAEYQCNFCPKTFPREKTLQTHLRVHTRERPFACNYPGCQKAFAQSGQLRTHHRLHSGEKPYRCPNGDCKQRFTHSNRKCLQHPEAVLIKDAIRMSYQDIQRNHSSLSDPEKAWMRWYVDTYFENEVNYQRCMNKYQQRSLPTFPTGNDSPDEVKSDEIKTETRMAETTAEQRSLAVAIALMELSQLKRQSTPSPKSAI